MIEIIKKQRGNIEEGLLDPIELFGAEYGELFQQYDNGNPTDDYAIGAGPNERPIDIWWDDESDEYRLSSSSKKQLKSFMPHIKYKRLWGDFELRISYE